MAENCIIAVRSVASLTDPSDSAYVTKVFTAAFSFSDLATTRRALFDDALGTALPGLGAQNREKTGREA